MVVLKINGQSFILRWFTMRKCRSEVAIVFCKLWCLIWLIYVKTDEKSLKTDASELQYAWCGVYLFRYSWLYKF